RPARRRAPPGGAGGAGPPSPDKTRVCSGPAPPPPPEGKNLRSPPLPAPPVAQLPAGPPPPPLTYVGKVTRDGESYAVLGREDRVYMVSIGDAVGNGYRVQSISEKEVVILNSDFGMRQTLPFSAAAPGPAP